MNENNSDNDNNRQSIKEQQEQPQINLSALNNISEMNLNLLGEGNQDNQNENQEEDDEYEYADDNDVIDQSFVVPKRPKLSIQDDEAIAAQVQKEENELANEMDREDDNDLQLLLAASQWTKCKDEMSGNQYWVNKENNEISFEIPPEVLVMQEEAEAERREKAKRRKRKKQKAKKKRRSQKCSISVNSHLNLNKLIQMQENKIHVSQIPLIHLLHQGVTYVYQAKQINCLKNIVAVVFNQWAHLYYFKLVFFDKQKNIYIRIGTDDDLLNIINLAIRRGKPVIVLNVEILEQIEHEDLQVIEAEADQLESQEQKNQLNVPAKVPKVKPKKKEKDSIIDDTNPWLSEECKNSRIIVRDEQSEYWQIGAAQLCDLYEWATMYFDPIKKSIFSTSKSRKSKNTIDPELLHYCEYKKFKQPLNKSTATSEDANKQFKLVAMHVWKNVCSYMGIRKSIHSRVYHVQQLIDNGIQGNEYIRDEIYCQLCKQTTHNFKTDALTNAWKLFLICCSFFPPSEMFVDYLACYIWKNTQEIQAIGQYAIKALHALNATMSSGARKYAPSEKEIQQLENCEAIVPIDIYFPNGYQCIQVLVSSQTRASQVLQTLRNNFNLVHADAFALYEMQFDVNEKPNENVERIHDHYIKRKTMNREQKIKDLYNFRIEREIFEQDRLMDVITSWKLTNKDMRSLEINKLAKLQSAEDLDEEDSKFDLNDNNQGKKYLNTATANNFNMRIVIRTKLFRLSFEEKFSTMGMKINFLTHLYYVLNDLIPLFEQDGHHSFDLAALQLQGTYGPNPQGKSEAQYYKHGVIFNKLNQYVPKRELDKWLPNYRSDCENTILNFRDENYSGWTRKQCWLKYAQNLRSIERCEPYFGCTWYRGGCVQEVRTGQMSAASTEEFESIIAEIVFYNRDPDAVAADDASNITAAQRILRTLGSLAKNMLGRNDLYQTLDHSFISKNGVLDFLMLLGFNTDIQENKIYAIHKPVRLVVQNAQTAINQYGTNLYLTKIKQELKKDFKQVAKQKKRTKSEPRRDQLEDKANDIVKVDRMCTDVLIGVNEYGVLIVDALSSTILRRYAMNEILSFGVVNYNCIVFVTGSAMSQCRTKIATAHTKAIDELLRKHYDFSVNSFARNV